MTFEVGNLTLIRESETESIRIFSKVLGILI